MYQLNDSVLSIKGIGKNLQTVLINHQIEQVLDFLLFLPLRYEDRSNITTIEAIKQLDQTATEITNSQINQKVKVNFVTTKAKVLKYSEYRKGRLLISRAVIADDTDQINCLWFNNKFLKNKIVEKQEYFFSGQIKNGQLMQARVEKADENSNNIHTGRLVPIYPQLADLKQGSLRRLLAETISKLHQSGEAEQIFRDLHFPSDIDKIIISRERLALEEIIYLMQQSIINKKTHLQKEAQFSLQLKPTTKNLKLPFELTSSQIKAVQEILGDLSQKAPMNRLLVGDVGSGKTIVAAIPASMLVKNGQNVCLIAPTKILAKQHFENLKNIFPEIDFELLSSDTKIKKIRTKTFYIGTHSLLQQLQLIKPSLVIYDEQQRFGVKHRQLEEYLGQSEIYPHLLSMTATPIPRSLMLSIFSHLDLSYLDQMPNSRKMATTWLVPAQKKEQALTWLVKELLNHDTKNIKQALIICPFINPSSYAATENVAAVKASLEEMKKELSKIYQNLKIKPKEQLKIDALHSKLSKDQQTKIIDNVYAQKIQILISTPMVEVGVDLPNADIIVINSAERFGLSSLHQLRGRVGRRGQESYCLLFTSNHQNLDQANNSSQNNQERLQKFCKEKDGLKLAQIDLENRGAGDLLGHKQSGLNNLHFASWTNLKIIEDAHRILKKDTNYQSFLHNYLEKVNSTATIKTATN